MCNLQSAIHLLYDLEFFFLKGERLPNVDTTTKLISKIKTTTNEIESGTSVNLYF